jgi:hypothetical protein
VAPDTDREKKIPDLDPETKEDSAPEKASDSDAVAVEELEGGAEAADCPCLKTQARTTTTRE